MSLTLHLGVKDIPYDYNPPAPKKAARKPRKRGKLRAKKAVTTQTTGDVAEILEAKYGLMQKFFDVKKALIAAALTQSVESAIENMLMTGAPRPLSVTSEAEGDIADMFKRFILTGEAETVGIPGTPTAAARKGVNHRLLHPYAKANPQRPSFRDTGLFESSFAAWVD